MIHRYVLRDKNKNLSKDTLYKLIKEPLVTEKSTAAQQHGQYFFKVSSWANKISIKAAVEHIFGVKVDTVNVSVLKGKERRFRGRIGMRSDVKKAMVRLEKGQKIDFEGGL